MTFVFVVETGDYEQRGITLIAASEDAAVAAIKARYGPPYRVRWEDVPEDGVRSLRGHFEGVPGYSIQHIADFDISEWEVEQLPNLRPLSRSDADG